MADTTPIPIADLPTVTPGNYDYVVVAQNGNARKALAPEVTAAAAALTEALDEVVSDASTAAAAELAALGYRPPVAYAASINLTSPNQTVDYGGNIYAPIASELPFTTSGTFEDAKFRLIVPSVFTTLAFPYADQVVDVLIVYGQSNARGYAGTTPGAPTKIPTLARMWNGSAIVPLSAYTPTANDGTSTGSAWAAFGAEYCSATGRGLVVVNCAKGSQSISDLSKPGANYTAMTSYVNGAVAAISAEGSTLGKVLFAFNQGERDSQLKTTASVYSAALAQLWTDVKADFGASRMGIFTVGYYATADMLWGQLIQQAQRLFARNTEDVFIAYDKLGSFGSHNKLKVDGVHYTQRGYNIMGREGARRFVAIEFPESSAPATDEQINRFGSLNMGQSQAWNLHAGFFQKSGTEPGWSVNHTSPRASSLVTDIDAASDTYKLNVKLACPARTIMFADARFHGPLGAAGIRAVVHNALGTTTTWPAPNADGVTVVPLYFYGDIHLRLNMAAATWDNSIMGATLASLKDSISVVFNSTGVATITHPTCTGFAKASIQGTSGKHIRVNGSGTSTEITVKDSSDANVNDVVHVTLYNMAIPHADIPVSVELSFAMIAADYAIW